MMNTSAYLYKSLLWAYRKKRMILSEQIPIYLEKGKKPLLSMTQGSEKILSVSWHPVACRD